MTMAPVFSLVAATIMEWPPRCPPMRQFYHKEIFRFRHIFKGRPFLDKNFIIFEITCCRISVLGIFFGHTCTFALTSNQKYCQNDTA